MRRISIRSGVTSGPFVPTCRDWATNNRSVAFRVPPGQGQARRIEHRVAGADAARTWRSPGCSPAIARDHDRLEASTPVEGRASTGRRSGFPGDLMVALERLEKSSTLAKYIPANFLHIYAESRRGEYYEFLDDIFPREYDFYV